MIIGLTGSKGSGKDTIAAYLIKEYRFERRAFADPMKKSVAALFDIPPWEVDNFKLDSTCYVAVGFHNKPDELEGEFVNRKGDISYKYQPAKMWSPVRELTFREV